MQSSTIQSLVDFQSFGGFLIFCWRHQKVLGRIQVGSQQISGDIQYNEWRMFEGQFFRYFWFRILLTPLYVFVRYIYSMGAKLCSNVTEEKTLEVVQTEEGNYEEFDNPKRDRLSVKFLNTNIVGSQNRLQQEAPYAWVKENTSGRYEDSVKEESFASEIVVREMSLREAVIKIRVVSNMKIEKETFIKVVKQNIQDKYKILQKVGEGGYGRVFRVMNLKNEELRAVKIIRKSELMRHLAEISIMKECDHPSIIQIFEIFEHGDFCYIVMEYCAGGSLLNIIKTGKLLGNQNLCKLIIKQVLEGLVYLENKKIAHRDIKPENIVLLEPFDPQKTLSLQIKIIDFGSAAKMEFQVNRQKSITGTVVYMPPEGFKSWYSSTYDVWSVAVMLYFMLSGTHPFKHSQKSKTIELIKESELKFKGSIWEQVSEQIKESLRAMLDKDYRKRPNPTRCLKFMWLDQNPVKCTNYRRASAKILKKMKSYSVQNNFVSIIQSYIAFTKTSSEDKKEIARLFKLIDTDKKGYLNREDLVNLYQQTGDILCSGILAEMVKKVDKNKSGTIDYSEFLTVMIDRQELFVQSSLAEAFDFFDKDNSGYIERAELKELLEGCPKDVAYILDQIDFNKDEKVSRDEFLEYFFNLSEEQKNEDIDDILCENE